MLLKHATFHIREFNLKAKIKCEYSEFCDFYKFKGFWFFGGFCEFSELQNVNYFWNETFLEFKTQFILLIRNPKFDITSCIIEVLMFVPGFFLIFLVIDPWWSLAQYPIMYLDYFFHSIWNLLSANGVSFPTLSPWVLALSSRWN